MRVERQFGILRGLENRQDGCYLNFFFNDTPTTEIYTLSLHDALPISPDRRVQPQQPVEPRTAYRRRYRRGHPDRKSTRLNSSHVEISYAVFCLKKKKAKKHLGSCGGATVSSLGHATPQCSAHLPIQVV